MALKRKGSRLIRVGGDNYRWTISRSEQAGAGFILIVIEAADAPGQRLVVRVTCRNPWLDMSDVVEKRLPFNKDAYKAVTPATVHKIILAGLEAGWSPSKRQHTVTYKWSEDSLRTPD